MRGSYEWIRAANWQISFGVTSLVWINGDDRYFHHLNQDSKNPYFGSDLGLVPYIFIIYPTPGHSFSRSPTEVSNLFIVFPL